MVRHSIYICHHIIDFLFLKLGLPFSLTQDSPSINSMMLYTVDGRVVFSPLVKPKKKRRRRRRSSSECCWLEQNFFCKNDDWPHRRDQVTGRAPAMKPVFLVAKPCNYIIMWCTQAQKDFFPQANIAKEASHPCEMTSFSSRTWDICSNLERVEEQPNYIISPRFKIDWNLTWLIPGCCCFYFCQAKGSYICPCPAKMHKAYRQNVHKFDQNQDWD